MSSIDLKGTSDALNQHSAIFKREIQKAIKQGAELENDLSPVTAMETYVAPNAKSTEVVQPYQTAFTPKMEVDFDAEQYTLDRGKVDIELDPGNLDKFYDKWMTEWVEDGKSRLEWTFPKYLWTQILVPQIIEDIELKMAWSGVKVPIAGVNIGVAQDAVDTTDGLAKRIADGIVANKITPITTGALSAATMVEKVEQFADLIPQPYRDLPGIIMMSKTRARQYYRDFRGQFGYGNGVAGNENTDLRVDGTNKVIKGYAAMEGSDRIIFNPANRRNLIVGFRRGAPRYPVIRWQEQDRVLKGLGEFHRFYGFEFGEFVFVNDQA